MRTWWPPVHMALASCCRVACIPPVPSAAPAAPNIGRAMALGSHSFYSAWCRGETYDGEVMEMVRFSHDHSSCFFPLSAPEENNTHLVFQILKRGLG